MKFNDLSITFHTNRMKECVDFYTKYFGARVTFESEWYVVICLESEGPGATPLSLSFQGESDYYERDEFAGGLSLNLRTKDVDACYEEIKRAGLTFSEEIGDHEWGDRAFSVKDPLGNIVYIYSDRPLHEKYRDAVKE